MVLNLPPAVGVADDRSDALPVDGTAADCFDTLTDDRNEDDLTVDLDAVGVADMCSDALPVAGAAGDRSNTLADGRDEDALIVDLDAAGVADMRSATLAAVIERRASMVR